MFEKRSKALFVCAILATIYALYLIIHFGSSTVSEDAAEALGGAIATAIVTPHMVVVSLGAIFFWLGFFLRKAWAALVGAILYCVGALIFLMYAVLCIPMIVLGFVGFAKQKNLMGDNV